MPRRQHRPLSLACVPVLSWRRYDGSHPPTSASRSILLYRRYVAQICCVTISALAPNLRLAHGLLPISVLLLKRFNFAGLLNSVCFQSWPFSASLQGRTRS